MIPIFTTTYSLNSILTVDLPPKKKEGDKDIWDLDIKDDCTTSVVTLALKYDLERPIIVEKNFTNFWECYNNFKEVKRPYVWGWRVTICADSEDKTPESEYSESDVFILLKSMAAYYAICKWATRAQTTNFYNKSRLSWKELQELWDEKLFDLIVPLHHGFLRCNLLRFRANAVPQFGAIKPIFLINEHGLVWEPVVKEATERYCAENNYQMIDGHQIYCYKDEDTESLQTYRCIIGGTTLQKPELPHFSVPFSFESYYRKINNE